jgi:C4-dicarboxylate transporter DctM subunit
MLQGGISRRLVYVANAFLSKVRGSLALISIVTCAFFGALSGSAMATTAAVGNVMYPEMLKDGTYGKDFALAVQAVGGTLGPMIPPSLPLIIYGMLANTSIAALFVGVVIPGIVMCLVYCIAGYWIMKRRNMGTANSSLKAPSIGVIVDALWALMTPVIILGGIYSGIFSPTESAAAASAYAFFVGKFVYRELDAKSTYRALRNATIASASVMFLVSCAMYFGWVLTIQGLPQLIAQTLISTISNKYVFLLIINVVFLIAGMFCDVAVILLLMVPIIYPAVQALGINMVHFGIIACINLSMGNITPPFGTCLFVASGIDKTVKLESLFWEVLPFCIAGVIGILITTFMPILSTWML